MKDFCIFNYLKLHICEKMSTFAYKTDINGTI